MSILACVEISSHAVALHRCDWVHDPMVQKVSSNLGVCVRNLKQLDEGSQLAENWK